MTDLATRLRRHPRLAAALEDVGAELVRAGKHLVFKLPNGQTFVAPKTGSDRRGEQNAIAQLMAVAGFRGLKPE